MHLICIVAWACAVLGHPRDSSEALVGTHSGGPKETDGRASLATNLPVWEWGLKRTFSKARVYRYQARFEIA